MPSQQPGPSGSNIQRSKEVDDEPPYSGATCVICLNDELNDPTILDCCQHAFCYGCINQWLLTNPSCPMCKKHLNKIKHELRPAPQAFPVQYNAINGNEQTVEDLLTDYEMTFLREHHSPMTQERRCIEDRLEQLYHRTIRLRSLAAEADITSQEIEQKRSALNEEIKNLTQLKAMIMNQAKRSVIFNTATFRRLIYNANLAPRPRLPPRFPADTSTLGIIANEALFRRRLIPFLIRELSAIIPRSTIDMSRYLDLVMNYLKTMRRSIRHTLSNNLRNSGVAHPLQFMSNVSAFLSSGQRMEVYDENCEYRVRGSGVDVRMLGSPEVEFLNETLTIPGGFPRQPRAMDNWIDSSMRLFSPPPAIVFDYTQNTEPDIELFQFPQHLRRGNNDGNRANISAAYFANPPTSSDNDVEVLNETITLGGGNRFGHPMGPRPSRRRPLFNSLPQVITLDDMANNDANDVEVVSQTPAADDSNPAPKRPCLNTPDLH